MANISSAEGRFIFEKGFVEKHGDLIRNWIDNHEKSYYGFDLTDDKLDSDGSIAFCADGRWAYCWTLKSEGIGWTDGDPEKMSPQGAASREAVMALARALADEKSKVKVEYTDFEPGCEVFYEACTTLSYKNEREFDLTEKYECGLDYNLDTICEKGFECPVYDFKEEADKEEFKEYVKKHYSKHLQKNKISLKSFVQKVIESALASKYRCGIILDYEVDDFELLRNIA